MMLLACSTLRAARPLRSPPSLLRCSRKQNRKTHGPIGHVGIVPACGGRELHTPQAASADEPVIEGQPARARLGKRKVALFVGYEGTGYKGLQMNPHSAPDATIEDTLEQAIYQAGGILSSNLGDLGKLGWGRSSRTDKSVHSLSTVISMKMECDPDSFEADPEGLVLTERINASLPPEMRVFSVQRVSKSFSARSECIRRSYHYYLPTSVLGLRLDGGAEDAQRLALLSEAWASFEGSHPFHNYTKRRLYRDEAQAPGPGARDRRQGDERRREKSAAAMDEDEEGSEGDASIDWESDSGAAAASPSSSSSGSRGLAEAAGSSEDGVSTPGSTSSSAPGSSSSSLGSATDGRRKGNKVGMRWTEERDVRDPVVRRHYRFMEWCRVGSEVVTLAPGGPPCVKLSLCGNSFMLHQIRKMVAASVAVARGQLPLEVLRASLAAPARVVLPLAPPMTLVLWGAQFAPFRKSWDNRVGAAALATGDQLQLRQGGTARQEQFWEQTLRPAVNELLSAEEWREWEANLEQLWYDPAELEQLVARHAEWQKMQEQRKQARLEGMLVEAQALENRVEE